MSEKTIYCCESCSKSCEYPATTQDWIRLTGCLFRAHGVMGTASPQSDYIGEGKHDYCSIKCLEKALTTSSDVNKKKKT